ncbi:MAG: hypothetical protein ABR568_22210, partial [Pyrinomonadaceae bacterium]
MYKARPGGKRAKAKHNYGSRRGKAMILQQIGEQPVDGKTGKEGNQEPEGDKGCRRGDPEKPGRYGYQIRRYKLNGKQGFG